MSNPHLCQSCGQPLPDAAPEGLCPRCLMAGAMQPTQPASRVVPDLEAVRTAFPQLEVLSLIGAGGMGAVFKARQPQLDRFVALKILALEHTGDARFAGRFQQEAQALARMNHPHIVTIHDSGLSGGYYYLLMEYVDGVNLRQAIQGQRLTPEQALAIVPPVCEALQFAHEHGIVHRDIKPENLLLDKSGKVKIADFGIAKMLGIESSPAGAAETQPAGTPQYMAPEQKSDPQRADHRADIYSLGVVLYEMLTGELPADKLQPPSARARGVQIDVRLDEVVLRALEKTPALRYQTAAEMRTQVEVFTGAFAQPKASAGTSVPPVGTSLPAPISRLAIAGAAWIAFFFVTFPLYYMARRSVGISTPGILKLAAAITFLPIGFTAPFGTTILGWLAVSKIRRSAGALGGLKLAVFDGVIFPIIILNTLVYYAICQWPLMLFGSGSAMDAGGLNASAVNFFKTMAVIGLPILDFWIVRCVWRTVAPPSSANVNPAGGTVQNQPGVAGMKVASITLLLLTIVTALLVKISEERRASAAEQRAYADRQYLLQTGQSLSSPASGTLSVKPGDSEKWQIHALVSGPVPSPLIGTATIFTSEAFPGRVFHGTVTEAAQAPSGVAAVAVYEIVIDALDSDPKFTPGLAVAVHFSKE